MYLEIEGAEGAYKTTICEKVALKLSESGIKHLMTRQPAGTPLAENQRELMKNPPEGGLSQDTILHLALAARSDLMEKVIKPSVKDNDVTISDRGNLTSVALQGFAGGIDVSFIERSILSIKDIVIPDVVFLISITHETSVARQVKRGTTDYIEQLGDDFHRTAIDGMLYYAQRYPSNAPIAKRIEIIDSTKEDLTSDEIAERIFRKIIELQGNTNEA